ncbi:MAG: ankyrin repeat domain-containing protein [Rickettsiales bacterium]
MLFFFINEAFCATKKLEINKLIEEPTKTYNTQNDIESLGLDNVDRQPKISSKNGNIEDEIKKAQEAMKKQIMNLDENMVPPEAREYIRKIKEENKIAEQETPQQQPNKPINEVATGNNIEPKNNEKNKTDDKKQNADEKNKIDDKKQNADDIANSKSAIIKDEKIEIKKPINIANKPIKKPVKKSKSSKKKPIKENLAIQESLNKLNQDEQNKEQEFQKKLNESRKIYLNDLIDNDDKSEEEILASENIAPIKKSLAPFAQDELPAIPILNRSRSEDNYHIPFIYTPKEYIDILFSAISMGSISYFNEAFKYVLNPNITNEQGDTILTYAIFLRKYSIIASVLAKGADPNLPNRLGYNPVHLAIEMNDYISLDLLEKNNADMFYIDGFGRTYLMLAAKNGFLPAVDLLVKKGVNINEMDNDGFTALSVAYRNKHELVVKYLLKNGAKTWIEKEFIPQKRNFIKELENRWK